MKTCLTTLLWATIPFARAAHQLESGESTASVMDQIGADEIRALGQATFAIKDSDKWSVFQPTPSSDSLA
jgi:hypothetical protein